MASAGYSLDHLLLESSQNFDHKLQIRRGHMFQPNSPAEVPTLATRLVTEEAFEMTPASATVLLQLHEGPEAPES